MKKKILITGVAGFIGSNFLKYLSNQDYEIYGIDFDIIKNNDERIFDFNLLDSEKTRDIFEKIKPAFVFHLAAFAGPPRNEENPKLAYRYNVEILKIVLSNLSKSTPIFFPSTDKVFVGHKYPNEKTKLNPDSVHGKVKLECEKLIKDHTQKFFIIRQPVVHSNGGYVRNSKMSGPGSFIDKAIDSIKSNKKVEIFANVKRCFIKIDELISVYKMLIESEKFGTYNLASPMISYYDRLVQICEKNKIKYNKVLIPTKGNIVPLEQDIDSSKFEKTFQIKMS